MYWFNVLMCILFMCLFQIFLYLVWKKGHGKKRVAVFYCLGRLHLFLFLSPVIFRMPSISLWLKLIYGFGLLVGLILDFGILFRSMRYCNLFRDNLRQDSKIIIIGQPGVRASWNPFYKWLDILLEAGMLEVGGSALQQKQEYLIVPELIAMAFDQEILTHPCYVRFSLKIVKQIANKKKGLDGWEKSADLYIIDKPDEQTPPEKDNSILARLLTVLLVGKKDLPEESYPFPKDKIRYMSKEDIEAGSYPQCMIDMIERGSGIREKIADKLLPYANYGGTEAGKNYLAQMIVKLLKKQKSVTEYFYEIIKLIEFMIHYQSLADYEMAQIDYFGQGRPVSLGTMQSGIVDEDRYVLEDKEAYIQAVKFLNQSCTGREGSINRKKLLREGRERLVMVRNHFIGHGSLTYGITPDFVEQLLLVAAGQIGGFMNRQEPMMREEAIHGIPKCRHQEGCLYLLEQVEKGIGYSYLDYGSGQKLAELE